MFSLNRSLLATLVIGVAAAGTSARADEPTLAVDLASQAGYQATFNCLGNICVGMTVRIIGGEWAGHAGQVIGVDTYQDEITVVNSSGYTLTPRSYDVTLDVSQPSATGCVANVCLGDSVRVLVGIYAGQVGTVVDVDDYNYTATILVGGRYIIEDIRDLTLTIRPTTYRPYTTYPRSSCLFGDYIYDMYRGCVRIYYTYPRPFVHRVPRPRPVRVYYPAPRHMPKPPRYYPAPRGPMPRPTGPNGTGPAVPRPIPPRGPVQPPRGPVQPPRGPVQPPRGPVQPRVNPTPSRPSQPPRANPAPSRPSQPPRMNPAPSRPQGAPSRPSAPSRPQGPSRGRH